MAEVRTTTGRTVRVLMRDLVGRKVRTRYALRNSLAVVPVGTICKVTGWWRSGVTLEAAPCDHCGVKLRHTRVHRDLIELVEDPTS